MTRQQFVCSRRAREIDFFRSAGDENAQYMQAMQRDRKWSPSDVKLSRSAYNGMYISLTVSAVRNDRSRGLHAFTSPPIKSH